MTGKRKMGFAALKDYNPERQKEIASQGGKAAHEKGTAHEFTSEEAALAGSKGGKSHSSEHMRQIGAKGGKAKRGEPSSEPTDDGQ